jgi:hypothetical protein
VTAAGSTGWGRREVEAAVGLHDRLVVQDQLVAVGDVAQLGLQLQPLEHVLVHVGAEQLVAVLAPGLGRVRGHVGVAEQLLGLVDARPAHGHAQAGLDRDGPAVEAERLVQAVEDPAGDRRRRVGVGDPLQQHAELVAAEAGRGVGRAQAALEAPGRGHQQLVAGGVAEAVVDVLEVVQVDEQHGQVARPGAGQGVLDPLGEQGAVGQAGQPVVERLVDELGLELLAVRDVAGVQHQAADVGVLEQVGGHGLRVQPGAVAVADPPGLGRRRRTRPGSTVPVRAPPGAAPGRRRWPNTF